MKRYSQIIVAAVLVLMASGAVALYALGGSPQDTTEAMAGHDHSAMSSGGDEAQPVQLDAEGARQIGVTFATAVRGSLDRTVETVGFVTLDETRLTTVNPKIEGWVEHLYVDFTGAPVEAGQPLLEIYSPPLVTAQEELILARNLLDEARAGGGVRSVEKAEELLEAARRRLAYWDVPEEEIRAMEERDTVSRTLTLRAPEGGIVLEKNVVEGGRVNPGTDLFRVADLSRVWVEGEIFEKDLSLVREGQHAVVTFEAYPGEEFEGRVTYIYPTVSTDTRTGRVRMELANPGLRLKPGMYARVELHGPPLEETVLVPRSAVLQTGERALVFHRMGDGRLHPMEVVPGLSAGDRIQILSGLNEGDVVVSSATFLIDAESNLGAAMAGMAGMDHSGMDHSGDAGEEMDHSGHDMSGADPDTSGAGDHSGHLNSSSGGRPSITHEGGGD
jgi:Cu(I)/Ag(I) efflux system membrane fusion protein